MTMRDDSLFPEDIIGAARKAAWNSAGLTRPTKKRPESSLDEGVRIPEGKGFEASLAVREELAGMDRAVCLIQVLLCYLPKESNQVVTMP